MKRKPHPNLRVAIIALMAFSVGYILRTGEKFVDVTRTAAAMAAKVRSVELQDRQPCMQSNPSKNQYVPSFVDPTEKKQFPVEVFYVWCGPPRHFHFVNYASVMSAIRVLQPESIEFHFENYPVRDKAMYYTWFEELLDYYPFLRLVELNTTVSSKCETERPAWEYVRNVANETGRIYIGENTILSQRMHGVIHHNSVTYIGNDTRSGVFKLSPANISRESGGDTQTITDNCTLYDHAASLSAYKCVSIFEDVKPESIWTEHSPFGRIMRWAAYGSEAIQSPCRSPYPVVPNIGHMIWFGGKPLSLTFYLSVLSTLYISGLDHLFVHGDVLPTGKYWEEVHNHPNVTFIYHSATQTIYGKEVQRIRHWSDVVRVDILLRYGGVYLDTDVVFVQPLPRLFREYDAVVAYTFPYIWPQSFPEYINNGLLIGRPGAEFFQEYQRSMKPFIDWYFGWNGMLKPYKILERNPTLARLSHHLQLSCCNGLCHPTWWPDDKHRPWNRHHLNSGIPLHWWNETVAIHFMGTRPTSLLSLYNLKTSHDLFGDIGRFVLEKAGASHLLD